MAPNAETLKAWKEAQAKAVEIAQALKKIEPKLKELDGEIRAEAKATDPKLAHVYHASIEQLITVINAGIEAGSRIRNRLSILLRDTEYFAAHEDEIEKLAKAEAEATVKLVAHFRLAQELQGLAQKTWDRQGQGSDYAFIVIARYEKRLDELTAGLAGLVKQLDPLYSKCEKAVAARDAKALADTKKTVAGLGVKKLVDDFTSHVESIDELEGGLKEQLGKDEKAKSQAASAFADLRRKIESGTKSADTLKIDSRAIESFKIAPIDVKKALKLLALPAAAEAKLSKVLQGPPAGFETGLSALGKELKVPTTGKAMLEILKRAKLV